VRRGRGPASPDRVLFGPYVFDSEAGQRRLVELFEGRLQLSVCHFMWLWEDGKPLDRGCPSCSGFVDEIARGHFAHLHGRR